MKLAALQAPDDCPSPHPQPQQLGSAYDRMLALRQLGNPPVKSVSAEFGT